MHKLKLIPEAPCEESEIYAQFIEPDSSCPVPRSRTLSLNWSSAERSRFGSISSQLRAILSQILYLGRKSLYRLEAVLPRRSAGISRLGRSQESPLAGSETPSELSGSSLSNQFVTFGWGALARYGSSGDLQRKKGISDLPQRRTSDQNRWPYDFGSQVVTLALLEDRLKSDPAPASVAREPRQTGCASGFQIGNHQSLLSLRW